jgi:potassium efflux system protein
VGRFAGGLSTVLRHAAEGFEVGNIAISPGALLAGLVILLLGIIITRYVTSWLQSRVLSATKLDKGAQDSIRTSAGYAGMPSPSPLRSRRRA